MQSSSKKRSLNYEFGSPSASLRGDRSVEFLLVLEQLTLSASFSKTSYALNGLVASFCV
jgi:hypothetical protein